ncbi:unnamed protein product [Knipowitschia caucasica]|uniref:Zinc-finger domain-containing protein n=1 Tax=Knipowitschia caucasica TaxID=637954 RepID=A0AAV2M329_KNICA
MAKAVVFGMHSLTKELAEVFTEDSDNDKTFYGFSEGEQRDDKSEDEDHGRSTPPAQTFSLRVALRPPLTPEDTGPSKTRQVRDTGPSKTRQVRDTGPSKTRQVRDTGPSQTRQVRDTGPSQTRQVRDTGPSKTRQVRDTGPSKTRQVRDTGPSKTRQVRDTGPSKTRQVRDTGPSKTRQVRDTGPSQTRQVRQKRVNFEQVNEDEEEEEEESFLAKREQNIKANKAMLAQLMADLQKIPGGAGFLKHAEKQAKRKSSLPPRSGDLRKNPERASRRRTRSMGGSEGSKEELEEELELSLEEELLQVKRAPRRRGAVRPSQAVPHVIRSVDDITAEELEQVADALTEKVYNKVTGSTCHQCRQKTIDTKTCCRSEGCRGIQGQFCGPCLRNRYGEDVKIALLDPKWACPPCRGICNCSFCRQREGRCPTGILFPLAQYHGFSDVHSYLTSLRNKVKDEEA